MQIDIKPDMLSIRYPMEVNLVGDSAETLRALLPLLEQKTDRAWREGIEGWMSDASRSVSPMRYNAHIALTPTARPASKRALMRRK